jgi:hypothetical protein
VWVQDKIEEKYGHRLSPTTIAAAAKNCTEDGESLSPEKRGRPPDYPRPLQNLLVELVLELHKSDVVTDRAYVTYLAKQLLQGTSFEDAFATGPGGEIVLPLAWFDGFWRQNADRLNPRCVAWVQP